MIISLKLSLIFNLSICEFFVIVFETDTNSISPKDLKKVLKCCWVSESPISRLISSNWFFFIWWIGFSLFQEIKLGIIPVLIISEYTLAHYKYSINICCEKNLEDFYDCLGTQPLKIVFSHPIDDAYVKRHRYDIYPDTDLNREYKINNNELYLDSNEIQLEENLGYNSESEANTSDEEDYGLQIKKGYDTEESSESDESENEITDEETDNEEIDVSTEGLEEMKLN